MSSGSGQLYLVHITSSWYGPALYFADTIPIGVGSLSSSLLSLVLLGRPFRPPYSPKCLEVGNSANFSRTEFSEVRIQQYGYFLCSTKLNGTFEGT